MPDDIDGARADVISHIIIRESGAITQGKRDIIRDTCIATVTMLPIEDDHL